MLRPYGLALRAEDQASFETEREMAALERSPVLSALVDAVAAVKRQPRDAVLAEIRGKVETAMATKVETDNAARLERDALIAEASAEHKAQLEASAAEIAADVGGAKPK